ncbi:MAG: hypothetical protein LBU85_12960 [Treponema sp.]|jgi:hypothetical protein|nr:hypothetical protein [Treponema sp.]
MVKGVKRYFVKWFHYYFFYVLLSSCSRRLQGFFQFFPCRGKVQDLGCVAIPIHHFCAFMPGKALDFQVCYPGKPPQGNEGMAEAVKG